MSSLASRALRTRWFVRAPITLFRLRAGWVFGGRVLLLEHRGRSSGRPRFVVLETVARPTPGVVVVASGFGRRAQWYRNIVATPACRVSIGRTRRAPATAVPMDADAARPVIEDYQRRHPRAWAEFSGVITEATGLSPDEVPLVETDLGPSLARRPREPDDVRASRLCRERPAEDLPGQE